MYSTLFNNNDSGNRNDHKLVHKPFLGRKGNIVVMCNPKFMPFINWKLHEKENKFSLGMQHVERSSQNALIFYWMIYINILLIQGEK